MSGMSTFQTRSDVLAIAGKLGATTALIGHGANPGLVSHFAKQALLEVAASIGECPKSTPGRRETWASLASKCGVAAMHIVERDTQVSTHRVHGTRANTWCVEGFLDEMAENAMYAAGTHERPIADALVACRHVHNGSLSIQLRRPARTTMVRSWAPGVGMFRGYLVPHAEVFSLAEYFALSGHAAPISYQPSVTFVYEPSACGKLSMRRNGEARSGTRVVASELDGGYDQVGVLILRHGTRETYWYGSTVDVLTARSLVRSANATTMQVAAGVLSGLAWIMNNPSEGLVEAEQLDHKFVLEIARPYLGEVRGEWAEWPGPVGHAQVRWDFTDLHDDGRVSHAHLI